MPKELETLDVTLLEETEIDPVTDWAMSGRIIAFHQHFAVVCADLNAGILLSQLWYWSKSSSAKNRDGWFYKVAEELQKETYLLGRREFENARRKLIVLGIIEIDKRDIPCKTYYKIKKARYIQLARIHLAKHPDLLNEEEG